MTEITIYNIQCAIIQKAGKPELWFLHSARHLIVLYTSVKFYENMAYGFQVTEES